MIVKCPKCRYQFDVPAWPGATQLQCNCPRCGTPFTASLLTDEPATSSQPAPQQPAQTIGQQPVQSVGQQPVADSPQASASSSSEATPPLPTSGTATPPPFQPSTSTLTSPQSSLVGMGNATPTLNQGMGTEVPTGDSAAQRTPQGGQKVGGPLGGTEQGSTCSGCLLKIVLIVFLAFAVLLFMVLQCDSEESYRTEAGTSMVTPNGDNDAPATVATDARYNARAKHQQAPRWIQGNWHVDTDFGGIEVKIKGTSLVESSSSGTVSGHIRYQSHNLFVDFGEGEPHVYRLDEEHHRIDAGTGLWMEKVE